MTFQEILDEYRIPWTTTGHHARPGWVQVDCPFCGRGSGKNHLGYNLAHNYCSCWKCGTHHVMEVLTELTNEPWHVLKEMFDVPTERSPRPASRCGRLVIPPGVGRLRRPHCRYLQRRGFETLYLRKVYGVQGIGLAARLAWRIFIPIRYRGQTVSWTTRSIGDELPPYITARPQESSVSPKDLLFGEDLARHAIMICEGPMDAMRIGAGAVATLGLAYGQAKLLKMSKYPIRYVVFDNEPDAQRRARELCGILQAFPGTTKNITLDAKDPGEASDKELSLLRSLLQ